MAEEMAKEHIFRRPTAGLTVDGERLALSLRQAFAGIAVGVAFLLTVVFVLAAVGLYLAGITIAVYEVGRLPPLWLPLIVVAAVVAIWVCFVASVLALDSLGVQVRGAFVYLCLPLGPLILALFGPLALFGALGRFAGARSVVLPFLGVLVLAGVAALTWLLPVWF